MISDIVYNFSIPKESFSELSETEQQFVLLIGRVLNDITVLMNIFDQRISAFSSTTPSGYMRTKQQTEILLLLRMLCGTIYESKDIANKQEFSSIVQNIHKNLPAGIKNASKHINRYFGKENLIRKIRNHFAFHASGFFLQRVCP